MNAVLPAGLASVDHSIASMDVGDRGWTMPWAMYHDDRRRLWINGSYPIYETPRGTVSMKIWRDDDGWHVDASQCSDFHWHQAGYVGEFPPIAVASFVR